MCQIFVCADRSEYVAGLQAGRGAGGPRTESYVLQGHKKRLSLHVGKAEIDATGVGVLGVSVEDDVLKLRGHALDQPLAQAGHVCGVVLHFRLGQLASSA